MTFDNIVARVQARLKLSSTESATRVGQYVNERYRAVQTSCGMVPVRFGSVNFSTVNGTRTYTPATLIHLQTLTYPLGNRVLLEKTKDFFRNINPAGTQTGVPEYYAIDNYNAVTTTIEIWPLPDAPYALEADGILAGSDLSGSNVPVLPEDFHDILIFGGLADELIKLEKPALADRMEEKFEKRKGELRYFIAKTAYLGTRVGDPGYWWWGPWFRNYKGFYG